MEKPQKSGKSMRDNTVNWSLRKGVASSLTIFVVLFLGLVIWVASSTRGAPQPTTLPSGLLGVIPQEGDQAPKQTLVGVSLSPGWEPTLIIDGLPIPSEQLDAGTQQLGEFFFSPGSDMVVSQLRRGLICARVIAIPIIDVEVDNIDHEWCWTSF
ncbi:MAG: hypothetical protein CNE88_07635 [Acidimicrobiales bacterium MED-G01]|nr:MAG: hypothetical protein CNE88_07635 [Acidimicrobiales bacterium MED-G01]